MKKALKLLILYFILLIAGAALGSLLYTFYLNILNATTGNNFTIFDTNTFLKALFYIIPCICLIICPFMAFVHISHKGGIFQMVLYVILSALTWLLILPFSLHYKEIKTSDIVLEQNTLSADYFRRIDDKVYYLTKDLSDYRSSTMVVLDTSQEGSVAIEKTMEASAGDLYAAAAPYRDVIIKDSFNVGKNYILPDFSYVISFAEKNIHNYWYYWLSFLSLGLLLSSLYAISGLFSWKLMNVGLIMILTYIILYTNSACLENPNTYSIIQNINSTALFAELGKYMYEPFIVCLNVLFAFIFITAGIIKFSVEKKRSRRGK